MNFSWNSAKVTLIITQTRKNKNNSEGVGRESN